jgi:uncharacterized membrane protein YcjF (UPF0283 family)
MLSEELLEMDQWSAFLQDRWYVLVIALVVLILIVKLVKTVVKWVVILALLGGVYYYATNYTQQFDSIKTSIGEKVASTVKDQAIAAAKNEAKDAKYAKNADGSFTIKSKSVQVDGKPGANDVKVTFMGQTFTVKMDETVRAFIDSAKQNK